MNTHQKTPLTWWQVDPPAVLEFGLPGSVVPGQLHPTVAAFVPPSTVKIHTIRDAQLSVRQLLLSRAQHGEELQEIQFSCDCLAKHTTALAVGGCTPITAAYSLTIFLRAAGKDVSHLRDLTVNHNDTDAALDILAKFDFRNRSDIQNHGGSQSHDVMSHAPSPPSYNITNLQVTQFPRCARAPGNHVFSRLQSLQSLLLVYPGAKITGAFIDSVVRHAPRLRAFHCACARRLPAKI